MHAAYIFTSLNILYPSVYFKCLYICCETVAQRPLYVCESVLIFFVDEIYVFLDGGSLSHPTGPTQCLESVIPNHSQSVEFSPSSLEFF